MNEETHSSPHSKMKVLGKILLKVVSLILLVFLVLSIFVVIYFYANRDYIAEKVLTDLNESTNGEVSFENISLYPFIQFPNISLALEEVIYYEHSAEQRDSLEMPIAHIKMAYAAIDVTDLFRNAFSISQFILEDGEIRIVKYPNKKLNVINAIKKKKPIDSKPKVKKEAFKKESDKPKKKTIKKKVVKKKPIISKELQLALDEVSLKNIKIEYHDQSKKQKTEILVPNLDAGFSIMPDSIQVSLNTQIHVLQLEFSKILKFNDQNILLITDFNIARNDSVVNIDPSTLSIGQAEFELEGFADFKGDGHIDFTIDGSDKDVSFFSLILSQKALNNIKRGDLFFKSSIKGNLKDELPQIECDFGLRHFRLDIPESNKKIDSLNIHGFFKSGNKLNFSEASLNIDTLNAKLPGGFLKGIVKINNFKQAQLDYELDLKLCTDHLGHIFKNKVIDSLQGNIFFSDNFSGQFIPDSGWNMVKRDHMKLVFDSVSFSIPNVLKIDLLDGELNETNHSLNISELEIITQNCDFLINGNIINASNFLFDRGSDITANLKIESDTFDLAKLLAYDPSIGKSFPYKINAINLEVKASTKASNFKKFKRVPKIHFNIDHLDGTITKLLAPITIKKGLFTLGEIKNTLFLDFKDFDIEIAGSELKADLKYYSIQKEADSLRTNVLAENLNLGKVFNTSPADSVPKGLNSLLNGDMTCMLVMPKKSPVNFSKIEFDSDTLSYIGDNDTVNLNSLQIRATNIDYNTKLKPNPLATLTGNLHLSAGKLSHHVFKIKDLEYHLQFNKGVYTILPENDKLFGAKATGKFVLSPFSNPPDYHLEYTVEEFQIQKLLRNFREDTLLTGPMKFNFDIRFSGDNKKSMLKSLNGNIHASGHNLLLYGLDIDEFLKKYKRSQNFSLLDVGAVVIAGPIGLAATKGTDYARIVISDHGESTNIEQMLSDWELKNGKFVLNDVAFATTKNRLAMKGDVNLNTDSLNLQFAVLNDKGCSVLSQSLTGPVKKPKLGRIKVIVSLLAPVTNLVDKTLRLKCDPFYEGEVVHPKNKENDENK